MRHQKKVAGVILLLTAATQGSLVYAGTIVKPQSARQSPVSTESARSLSDIPAAKAEEPPSTPPPTAAPTATPTPTPEPTPVERVLEKPRPTGTPKPIATKAPVPVPKYSGTHEEWMAAAGIAESDYGYVEFIIQKESGWNPSARNGSEGACGLVQALPCSKLGPNWQDPVNALKWGNSYVSRYGGWAGAYAHWLSHHWY